MIGSLPAWVPAGLQKAMDRVQTDIDWHTKMGPRYADELKGHQERLDTLQRLWERFADNLAVRGMTEIVERKVEAYHADFYLHDLSAMAASSCATWLWAVRDTGTYIAALEGDAEAQRHTAGMINFFCHNSQAHHEFYLVSLVSTTRGKITPIGRDRLEKLAFTLKKGAAK